ncbi:hypothetical protein [Amycolatopsis sp. YIM 10]|uniref:hypothetical protein n=1 Tax=Amycolatopsis sp. YIM 10 TaxID=2653857 RepID=UPI0012904B40|nr:hypothetical protein [Amycolatopsis sp. YIM 10]QFU94116.1 hypothetical protein YIM_44930 [Amycolatopsis sp. YIM 10]
MTTPDQPPGYTPPGSGGFLDQLGEAVGELGKLAQATGASAGAPSGGYSFEPDQLIDIAREWDDLADGYVEDMEHADILARVEGPGAEYASGDNAQLVRQSGEALLSALRDRVDYCRAQAEKFRSAAGQYAEAEASAGDEIGKQGGSL